MASLREDLAEAKDGEPMLLAWNYVLKALEEIEWLRARELELQLTISGKTFCDPTDVRVVELEEENAQLRARLAFLDGEKPPV